MNIPCQLRRHLYVLVWRWYACPYLRRLYEPAATIAYNSPDLPLVDPDPTLCRLRQRRVPSIVLALARTLRLNAAANSWTRFLDSLPIGGSTIVDFPPMLARNRRICCSTVTMSMIRSGIVMDGSNLAAASMALRPFCRLSR